jgi:MFS family permease
VAVAPVGSLTFERNTYYGARLLAQVAQNLLFAALFVIAGTSSHAAIGLSSIFVAMLVPAVLFGLLGGAIVDRVGPARGFFLGAVLRFSVAAGAAVFMHGAGQAWIAAFAFSAASQVFSTAEMALVREVRKDHFGRAHSLLVAFQYGGQAIGMGLIAPALWWFGGANLILEASAVGFLVLTGICFVLAVRLRRLSPVERIVDVHAFSFRRTVLFFHREALARDAVTVLAIKALVTQVIVVALPLYLTREIGLGKEALAFLIAPGAIGTVIGLIWAGPAVTRERAGWFMRAGLLGMTVGLFALAALDYGLIAFYEFTPLEAIVHFEVTMNTTFIVAMPVALLIGLSLSLAMVAARVALTETAPLGQQARVFAVQSTLTEILVVAPLLLMGVGTQYAGARPTLAAIGILGALAFLAIEHPRFKPAPQPASEMALVPVPVEVD